MQTYIVKNNNDSIVKIKDLHDLSIPANGELDLSDHNPYTISQSSNLKGLVADSTLTVYDGNSDLSSSNGLYHLKFLTEYELRKTYTLPGTKDLRISLNGKQDPFIEVNASSYTLVQSFMYRGSSFVGSFTGIKILAHITREGENGDIRLVNSSNGDVITSITNINSLTFQIYSSTILNNIPINDAVLELQGKTSLRLRMSELLLYY